MKGLLFAVLPLLTLAPARAEQPLPDYTTPAAIGEPRPYVPPPIQETTLANEMKVALMESTRLAVASIQIAFPFAGNSADPKDKVGLSALVASLMGNGTAGPNGLEGGEFAKAMQRFGANWGIEAGRDSLTASITVGAPIKPPFDEKARVDAHQELLSKLDGALGLLSDALRRPLFAQADIDRTKAQLEAALQAQQGDPVKLAAERLRPLIFQGHPYGFVTTTQSVANVTRDDLDAFQRNQVSPAGAVVAASGDLTLSELEALAKKHFGDWQATREQRDAAAHTPARLPGPSSYDSEAAAPAIELIDYSGQPQATILGGQLGLERKNPERIALQVAEFILGGNGSQSRLQYNLRKVHGWTYGAGTQMDLGRLGGDFFVIAPVRGDVGGPALVEILKELRRIREEPVSDAELADAKTAMPFGFVKGLQSVEVMAGQVADVVSNDMPRDLLATYKARVLALTPANVQAAAVKYLRPDRMRWVVVGDAKSLCPQLQAAGVASVRVTDVEGKPEPSCGGAG